MAIHVCKSGGKGRHVRMIKLREGMAGFQIEAERWRGLIRIYNYTYVVYIIYIYIILYNYIYIISYII